MANFGFPCLATGCSKTFKKYSAFQSHVYRDHAQLSKKADTVRQINAISEIHCQVSLCAFSSIVLTHFLSHLKSHLNDGTSIACPFNGCQKVYIVKSSFTAHLTRHHKGYEFCNVHPIYTPSHDSSCSVPVHLQVSPHEDEECMDLDDAEESCVPHLEEKLFLEAMALFYLKLQAKLLLPASTIQEIISELHDLHLMSRDQCFFKLKEKL